MFGAQIPKGDFILGVFRRFDDIFFGRGGFHAALNAVSADLFQLGFFIGEVGGDHAVHHADTAELAGEGSGVDIVKTDDVFFFEEGIDIAFTAEVGGGIAPFSDDIAFDLGIVAFKIFGNDAVVADQREGLDNDLSVVAGVGQCFQISDHTGGKNDFAQGFAFGAEALSLIDRSVGQQEINFFAHFR